MERRTEAPAPSDWEVAAKERVILRGVVMLARAKKEEGTKGRKGVEAGVEMVFGVEVVMALVRAMTEMSRAVKYVLRVLLL